MTVQRRRLIVNADDFGFSAAVDRGIAKAYDRGIVTSASLLVRHGGAIRAARLAARRPGLSVGLHVDLGEWTYEAGAWAPIYVVVDQDDPSLVRDEVLMQLATFRKIVGRDPTHLDSHQHVHLHEPLRSVLEEIGDGLGIPVRHLAPDIIYRGDFYGQTSEGAPLPDRLSVEALCSLIEELPAGITELACHPATHPRDGDPAIRTMYDRERSVELEALCDPAARATLEACRIDLISFHQVRRDMAVTMVRAR